MIRLVLDRSQLLFYVIFALPWLVRGVEFIVLNFVPSVSFWLSKVAQIRCIHISCISVFMIMDDVCLQLTNNVLEFVLVEVV